jgi:cell division protein FtsL
MLHLPEHNIKGGIMELNIDEKDRVKILSEISDSQNRVIQIFVPTILAIGLISIADKEKFALTTLFAAFAILFSSSLYIASLSYKIFRNAMFLRAVTSQKNNEKDNVVHWEKALSIFTKKVNPPKIIGYETKTIAIIFIMFAFIYTFMFYYIHPIASVVLGLVLISVAIRILFIPFRAEEYYNKWQDVLKDYK